MGILLLTSRTQVINSQANYGMTASSPYLRVCHNRVWLLQQHCLKKMNMHQDKDLSNGGSKCVLPSWRRSVKRVDKRCIKKDKQAGGMYQNEQVAVWVDFGVCSHLSMVIDDHVQPGQRNHHCAYATQQRGRNETLVRYLGNASRRSWMNSANKHFHQIYFL